MTRAWIGALLAGSLVSAPVLARAADIFPLEHVGPGMNGIGRTVFEGTRIDEFKVEILGVLENALGPKQSVILARLEGGPLEKTGVIAGMSGSPVFIDGKLVGAVAYSFPFSKETIAGITPIDDMIEATEHARAAGGLGPLRSTVRERRGLPARPRRRSWPRSQRPLRHGPGDGRRVGAGRPRRRHALSRWPCPWSSRASTRRPSNGRAASSRAGLHPHDGGASGGTGAPAAPARPRARRRHRHLARSKATWTSRVTGTVTHIDGDRVYAFGHPFYNLGPHAVPDEEGLRVFGLPEPLAVLEDLAPPSSGGHGGAGPDHRHRGPPRQGAPDDPGRQ